MGVPAQSSHMSDKETSESLGNFPKVVQQIHKGLTQPKKWRGIRRVTVFGWEKT